MRFKSLALLMLALGCGLVASIGITQVMAKRNATSAAPTGETESIFVALQDIGLGEILTAQDLKLEPWPKDKVPPGALSRIEDVEGRRTKTKIFAGEPILDKKLFGKGVAEQGPDALIPKGYRVVAVKVDQVSGTAGMILPGSRVDVLVHLLRNPTRGIPETSTRVILQDIKVFAVNDRVTLEPEDSEGGTSSIKATTVSLLVTPEQAAKLALAEELGKLRLVLRSPEDDAQATQIEANPSELFGMSDGGNREGESLLGSEPQTEAAASTGAGGLLSFLAALQQGEKPQPEPQPEQVQPAEQAPPPEPTWTIRILKPDGVEEVVLRETPEKGVGMPRWRRAEEVESWPPAETTQPAAAPMPEKEPLPELAPPEAGVAEEPVEQEPPEELVEPD